MMTRNPRALVLLGAVIAEDPEAKQQTKQKAMQAYNKVASVCASLWHSRCPVRH